MTTFGYDKVGNRQSVIRQDGTAAHTVFSTTGYTYNSLNRLTDIVSKNGSNGLVSSYNYGLRADGKRYSVVESGPATNGGTTNYFYDDQGKLTQEAGPYATIAYGYDNVGNRLTRTVTNAATGNGTTLVNGVTNTAYDQNDRIIGHTYDANGNETTVNGQTAAYDFENHLVSLANAVNNTVLTSYVYDADGNRYSAGNSTTTTSYVVDTSLAYASVVEEYSNGTLAARYDYGDDLVRMDRGGVYYYLYDGLGSTRQLVNAAGAVTDTYGYSAFGELAAHTGSTVNPFLFNAQQFDQASGDYYLRARYYDQSSGRFISQDPFEGRSEDPITLHRYLYANNDSVDRIDPGGRESLGEILVANSIGIGLGAALGTVTYGVRYGAKYALKGTIVGAQFGFAISYARTNGNIIPTITSALFVGLATIAIEYLGDLAEGKIDDFYKDRNDERLFLEGAANGAVTGALGDAVSHPGILAFGLTVIQDGVHEFPSDKAGFVQLFSDSLTQAIVAEATGAIVPRAIDADGLAKVSKLLPEFLSGEASTHVAIMLGALWATPVGVAVKEYFDSLKDSQ